MCVLVKSNILVSAIHCTDDLNNPEDEILYGTAGFLQTLLLLRKELGKTRSVIVGNEEAEKKWADFMTKMDSVIT